MLTVMLLVLAVFLISGSSDEWANDQRVYLRNRTGTPLRVELTVPRAALGVDTVWWGITTHGTALVRAAVVRQLYVPGLELHLTAPVLLSGAADTLVPAGFQNEMRYLGNHRTFNLYQNMDLWVTRAKQARPAFSPGVQVLPLPTQPDSVRLILSVAPDSLLWVATVSSGFSHGDPDRSWIGHHGLKPVVNWRDRAGRFHRRPFPTNHWLDAMQQVADQRGRHSYHLTHYVDYR